MGISAYGLAKDIGVSQIRISEIIAGKRAITVDTGLRLSRYFGMNDGFWTGLQLDHDAAVAKDALAQTLASIRPVRWLEDLKAQRTVTSTFGVSYDDPRAPSGR
jgi:addiction module HigA family antidote